jgi:hypothetical protein
MVPPGLGPGYRRVMLQLERRTMAWVAVVCAAGCVGACVPADRVGMDSLSDVQTSSAGHAVPVAAPAKGVLAAPADDSHASASAAPTQTVSRSGGAGGDPSASASLAAGSGGSASHQEPAGHATSAAGSGGMAAGPDPGSAAGSGAGTALDAACDLNGVWMARLTTFSRDSVFNSTQTASNWYYYELAQSGRDVVVSKAIDCGFQVSGSADITLNNATSQALLHRNEQSGRTGQFYRDADHCTFSLTRFYSTRGVPRATYLPKDVSGKPELASIVPALPTEQSPSGAEDWDNDGYPGIAINVAGLGSRHVVQRDWNEFFSDAGTPVALNAREFVVRANFDVNEEILAVSGGLGALLRAGAVPASGMRHRIIFRFLGRTAADPAVAQLRGADDLQTCYKVQAALPHDTAMQ